jgi:hypothetical protein
MGTPDPGTFQHRMRTTIQLRQGKKLRIRRDFRCYGKTGESNKGVFFQTIVNLYEAMGGGWALEADRLTGATIDSKITTHGSEVLHANQ